MHIVLTDEQVRLLTAATDHVELRDQQGNRLGYVAREFTHEDIAVARQRQQSDERRLSTAEVRQRMRTDES